MEEARRLLEEARRALDRDPELLERARAERARVLASREFKEFQQQSPNKKRLAQITGILGPQGTKASERPQQ